MRFLHKLYFDTETLAVLYLSFQDADAMEDGDAEDARVFAAIGNDPSTVTVLLWAEPNAPVEEQLRCGLVPSLRRETLEGETRVALDFIPRGDAGESAAGVPSYGELVAALETLGVSFV